MLEFNLRIVDLMQLTVYKLQLEQDTPDTPAQ